MVISTNGFTFNASTKTITAYSLGVNSSNYAYMTIPAQIDGVDVEHIAASVFYGKYIMTIDFETGSKLKTIGSQAFRSAYIYGSITLPSTVTDIGTYAFYGSKISSMTTSANITSIGTYAFATCTSLMSANFNGSVGTIDTYAFSGATVMTSFSVAAGLTTIGAYAFNGCVLLAQVALPNTVTTIADRAFTGCTQLMTINWPTSLTTIGAYAFNACTSLMNVSLSSKVTTISNYAFYGCTSLSNLSLSEGLTSIGSNAFYNSALTNVTLPASLQQVGTYAFACAGTSTAFINSVTFLGGVSSVGNYVFNNQSKLDVVSFDQVTSGTLTTTNWGGSPTYVWAGQVYAGNFILETATNTVISFINDAGASQVIPNEFVDGSGKVYKPTALADSLFSGNTVITEVTIPDTVQTIGYRTFYGCTKLSSVNMPTALVSIDSQAFYNCTALASVETYDNLVSIGSQAFYNCQAMSDLRLGNKLQTIGNSAFYQCYGLGMLTIPDSVTSIGTYAFYANTKLTEVTIGSGLTSISNYAFAAASTAASSITLVTMKGNMSSISSYAFTNQTKIGQIYLTGVTNAQFTTNGGSGSPWGATAATIVWSDTGYEDGYIFETATGTITGYTGTESLVNIPEEIGGVKVQHIGAGAFSQNTNIVELIIPDTVLTIGSTAFYRCTKLKSVTIGTGITTIGANAFAMQGTGTTYTVIESITIHGLTDANASIAATAFTNFPTSCFYYFTNLTQAAASAKSWTAASNWGGAVTTLPSTTAPIIWADTVYEEGFIFDKGTQTLRGYKGTELAIVIPDEFDGVEVKIVGQNSFYTNTTITEVVIPDTVETIMSGAFYRCTKLRQVEIGSGINTIGASAFAMQSYSSSYTSMAVMVIHGLTGDNPSIASNAFTYFPSSVQYYFTNVESAVGTVNLGSASGSWGSYQSGTITWAEYIRQDNFVYNINTGTITSFSGSNAAVEIPDEFFRAYAHDKADTEIGYAPTAIGDSVFASKTAMTSVYIPNTIVSIGNSTFNNCTVLQTITGGEGIKSIGNYAFRYNYLLLNLPLPTGLETIGAYAFQQCNSVQSIEIPDTVTSIATYAFYYCSSLKEISVGTGVTDIPTMTFSYHSSYTSSAPLERVTFNGVMTSIHNYGFRYQNQMQEIILMNNEESSITGSPWAAPSSTAVVWGEAIIEDGYVFNKDTGVLAAYRGTETSPTIPSDFGGVPVTRIASNAFLNKTTITEVTIPASITQIDATAFSGCTNLLKVTIEGDFDTDAITINAQAFMNCTNLLEMHIYGPVTSMATNALSGANKVATMHFKHMGENTVAGYTSRWGSSNTAMTIGWADTVIQDGFIFDSDTLSVTGYVGTDVALNIPAVFTSSSGQEFIPKHIGASAFTGKTTITSMNMPDTIETIGDNAFYGCTNMIAIMLSDKLTSIGANAFYNNTTLIGITIPDSVKTIGDNAFYNAKGMSSVIVGSGLESIGYRAFYGCTSLTYLTFGENLKTVGSQAFAASTGLKQVKFTSEIEENGIGSAAFNTCTSLEYIFLSENEYGTVTGESWGGQTSAVVLWKYYLLTDDFVFNGVTQTLIKYIGSDLEVIIPESFEIDGKDVEVLTIGENALLGNTKMMSLVIPDTVTTIKESAFQGCTALAQVSVGEGVSLIEDKAFYGCTALTKVALPEATRIIGAQAFYGCTKLAEIIIPGNIEVISTNAFTLCSALEIIYVPKHTEATLSGSPWGAPSSTLTVVWSNLIYENGFIYDIATETITRYVGSDATVSIPEYFYKDGEAYAPTNIGEKVFQSKTFITRVIIPDTVEVIETYAFASCTKLTNVSIGNGVKEIGTYAFNGCTTLTTLTLGNSIQLIDGYAFQNAALIKELVLPDSLEEIGTYAFNGLVNITELTIPNKVKTIGAYAFNGAVKLMDLTIGDSVTDIYGYAFSGAIKLTNLTLGESVTNIWTYAFYNAQILAKLEIPASTRFIDSYAFAVASSATNILTDIVINAKLNSMDVYAFRYRTNVEIIALPEIDQGELANANWGLSNGELLVLWSNFIYQDEFVFDYNTGEVMKYRGSQTTVEIPSVFTKDGVDYKPTSIGASAFAYNTVIQSVTVPASIVDVGTLAFRSCTALKEVIFMGEMNTIGTNAFLTTSKLNVIYLPQNEEGSVTGSPWGASTSITTILWSNYVLQNGFIFDIATSEIFKYIGSDSVVTVPSVFTKWVTQGDGSLEEMTYKATKIANNAFTGNTLFTEVTIAEGITDIGNYAFTRTANLTHTTANAVLHTVNFPSTLEVIGIGAFYYCTALTNAELPDSLLTISNYAFFTCSKLGIKEIPRNVKTIGQYAFRYCTSISELNIGDSVTSIGYCAFSNASNLKTVTIGTGIQTIDEYAFNNCPLLENVYINGDINSMARTTFRYCTSIQTVHLPQKMSGSLANSSWVFDYLPNSGYSQTTATAKAPIIVWRDIIYTGDYLFNTTTGTITKYYGTEVNLTIPKTFTKEVDGEELVYVTQAIGASAFASNTTLQSVTIPDSITTIETAAFRYCSNMTDVVMEGKIDTIGTNAFGSTSKLKIISLQENETGTVTGANWGGTTADVIWSNNIYASDFIYDIDTKTVTKYIGSDTVISIPSSFTKGTTTYSTDTLGTSLFLNKTTITKVTIPNSVTTIGNTVFSGCTNLQEVVMSENVTSIGTSAFLNCQKMHTMKFPLTLESLGVSAFQNCYALTEIIIGDNLATIPNNAFYNCYGISTLEMGSGVKTIGEYAFYNTNALTEVTLGSNVTAIGANAFNNASNLKKITIPSDISSIGTYAFRYCNNLEEIHIPQKDSGTVTGSAWSASYAVVVWKDTILTDEYIYSISSKTITKYRGTATNVTVPSVLTKDGIEYEVEIIGSYAFASNSTVQKITLPETLVSVADYAFQSSPMLSEIIFTSEIARAGYRAFYNLASIQVVVFPENMEGTVANQSSWALSSNAVIVWKNLVYLDQFVYEIESKTVTKYLGSATTVVVPTVFEKDGVEYTPVNLGASIFYNKTAIVSVSLPEGMEVIETNAMRGMTKLKTVTLPSTLTTINNYAFYGNTTMSQITLPDGLQVIEEQVFYNCDGLTEVTLPANMERIGNQAFAYSDNILKVTLKGKINTLGTYIFRDNTKLNSLDIQSGVQVIGTAMFYNCDLLTKVVLPATVTTINDSAFGHCAVLSQVFIPESTTSIATNTFTSSNTIQKIYVDQFKVLEDDTNNPLANNAPWGAGGASNGYANVYWRGETVSFAHTIQDVSGSNNKIIDITASLVAAMEGGVELDYVILPDGSKIEAVNGIWSASYPVSQNGTYKFTAVESSGAEDEYEVDVYTVGIPTVKAKDSYIEATDLDGITVAKLVELTEASVTDDENNVLNTSLITIDQDDIDAVKALTDHGESAMITLTFNYLQYATTGTKSVVITLVKGKQITISDHNKVNLGAYWMEYGVEVNSYAKDGALVESVEVESDTTSVTLKEPASYDGYTFSYWSLRQNEDQSVTATPIYLANNLNIMFKDHDSNDIGEYELSVGSNITTYDKDGNVVGAKYTVAYDDIFYKLAEPAEVTGFDFTRWTITKLSDGGATATPVYTRQSYEVKVEDQDEVEIGTFSVDYLSEVQVYNSADAVSETHAITEATTITLGEPSEKTGYTFASWTGLKEASGNVAIKPSYTINSYPITIKDSSNVVVGQPTVQFGKKITAVTEAGVELYSETVTATMTEMKLPSAPEKEGYACEYWEIAFQGDGSVIVTPFYKINSYTIQFQLEDGTVIRSQEHVYNEVLIAPAAPSQEGQTFTGWDPAVDATVPAKNTVYTATYTNNLYALTFWDEDGTTIIGSSTLVEYGDLITAPTPTKAGYVFTGWLPQLSAKMPASDMSYTATYQAGTGYSITFITPEGNVDTTRVMDTGDAIEIRGSAGELLQKYEITGNEDITLPTLYMEGSHVSSWSYLTTESGITITPVFAKNTYDLTFVYPDGTVIETLTAQEYGASITTPSNPSLTGYSFTGWNPSVPSTVPGADTTYTAVFNANTYIAKFLDKDGNILSQSSVEYGTAIETPDTVPDVSGHTFIGWTPAVPATMPAEAQEFVATYQGGVFDKTIELYSSTGDYVGTVALNVGDEISVKNHLGVVYYTITITDATGTRIDLDPATVNSGYEFLEWKLTVDANNNYTLTPSYEEETYTATFYDANGNVIGTAQELTYGSIIQVPADSAVPEVADKKFSGWLPVVPSTMPNNNVNFVAQYTDKDMNRVTITSHTGTLISDIYVRDGAEIIIANGDETKTVTITGNQEVRLDEPASKEGYNYDTWQVIDNGDDTYSVEPLYTIGSYTMTFMANGSTYHAVTSNYGDRLTAPADPISSVSGEMFAGWSPVVPSTVPATDQLFIAQFSKETGVLVYVKDFAGEILDQIIFDIGEQLFVYDQEGELLATRTINANTSELVLPEVPTREGYTFTGWDIKELSAGNVTASITYEINYHTVRFEGVDGSTIFENSLAYGTAIDEPSNIPEVSGKTFAGWNPALLMNMPDADVTFTATYVDGDLNIIRVYDFAGNLLETLNLDDDAKVYIVNEFGNEITTQTVSGNGSIYLPEVPAKDGHDPQDWIITVSASGNATIKRDYSKQEYTIIFRDEDGTVLSEETYEYGDTVVQPDFPTTGGVFGGWDPDFKATAEADVIYYAQYASATNAVTVNFYDENGTFVGTKAINTGTEIVMNDSNDKSYGTQMITATSGSIDITLPTLDLSDLDEPDDYELSYWELFQSEPGEVVMATAIIIEKGNMLTFLDSEGEVIQEGLRAPGRIIIPPDVKDIPVVEGKTFSGWTPSLADIMPDIEMSYTATYATGSFHIITIKSSTGQTLDYKLVEDGEKLIRLDEFGNTTSEIEVKGNTVVTLEEQLVKEGYTPAGYEITQSSRGDELVIQSNYDVNSYVLRFEEEDGTLISEQDVDFGTDLSTIIPADPTKVDHTFTGWDPHISGTMPSNDITYTGTFVPGNYYSIDIYDHEGNLLITVAIAEGNSGDIYLEDGTLLVSHEVTNTSTVQFFGLMTTSNLIEEIHLPNPESIENLEFVRWDIIQDEHGDTVTIVPIYEGGPFTATFYDEDETTELGGGTFAYASNMDVPVDPTKEGYTFTGWENQNTDEILGDNIRVPNMDTVYFATYEINQYTISFEDEDGNSVGGALASQTLDFGKAYEVPATPDKEGHILDKWVVKDTTDEIDMDNLVVPATDVTYVLVYKFNTYTATFYATEAGDENETVHEVMNIDYTNAIPTPDTLPVKEGYRFIQWSPVPEATMPAKDTEYWPIFEEGTGNVVTIYDHEGKEFGSKIISVDGSIIVKDNPEYTITIGDSTSDATLSAPNAPEGYSYDSWIIEQDKPDADVIVTPQFTINSYNVTFVDRDGNAYTEDEYNLTQEYASDITVPSHKAIAGYTFDGWLDNDGNEILQSANPTVPAKDTTYKATYTAISYKVTFTDEDGSEYAEDAYNLTIPFETNISIPAGKDKVGYTFVGWENGSDLINTGDTVKVPLNGITYKAKYEVNQYDMVFYAKEQSESSSEVHETLSLDYLSAMQVPDTTPHKDDYTFIGWEPSLPSTVPANTLEFWPTYVYGVGESIKITDQDGAAFGAGYIMVEAGNKVIINLDADGNNTTEITVEVGQDDIQLPTPSVANGYAFEGWEASEQEPVGGDITFTPVYSLREYTMTFVDKDGEAYTEDEYNLTQEYTSDVVVPQGKAVIGYDFSGWLGTDGTLLQAGDTDVTMPAKNSTYTATYTIRTITVSYFDVEVEVIDAYTVSRDYNTTFTIPNGPAYEGHTFSGWSIKTAPGDWDDTQMLQAGESLFAPATDIEFQANYDVNQYTVRFEDYNQSLIREEEEDYNTVITPPADRIREGYTFTGWVNLDSGDALEAGVTTVPSKAVTYVATYEINTYSITYYSEADGSSVHYTVDLEYGESVIRPNVDPIKSGYTFMGWTPSIPTTMPADDLEIYPIYVEGIQDIIKISDHTGKLVQSVIVDAGEKITVKYSADKEFTYNITNGYPNIQLDEPPAITGNVFTGWLLEQAADGGSVVLTPQYAKETYTIKFINYNGELYGGAISVQVLEYGASVDRPADPVRSGYTFTGWTPVFSAIANGDVIYTATYEEGDGLSVNLINYTGEIVGTYAMAVGNKIEQYNNDGSVIKTTLIADGVNSVQLEDPEEIEGYDFQRWDITQQDNGNIVVEPVFYGASKAIEITDNDGKVLADVSMLVGTSVYQLNGNGEIIATIPILPNTSQVKATAVTDITGYTFTEEWNITKDEDGNYTIAPNYTINSYTIMFVDYDNWIMQEQELEYASSVSAPSNPIRSGYTFIGWSPSLSERVPASDVIYKAVYEENVTSNGTTGGDTNTNTNTNNDIFTGGSSNYYGSSSTTTSTGGTTSDSSGTISFLDGFDGDMILPSVGDINIDGATINNENMGGDSYTDRANNGYLNVPITDLHLYHIVLIGSGLLGFVLMFKKRRLDDEYGDELFLRRLNKKV